MKGKKKQVKKAAKKEAAKEVKKILKTNAKPKSKRGGRNILHGRGGYWGDLGKRLGGHLGGVADEVVGIGKALTGKGSYRVRHNTIYESGGPPSIVNTKYTSIVRHREYICDIVGSTTFSIQQFPINPGVVSTFPWLSNSANSYEQYIVRGMVFEFHSTAGTAVGSTNIALGSVIMATEYNSNLPAFTSKLQMENHEYTTPCAPDKSAIHPIECARSRTVLDELYVRSANNSGGGGGTSATYNPLLYDLGQFYIATVGLQASATIGELWVSYEIEFLKPAMSQTIAAPAARHLYWYSPAGSAPSNGSFMANVKDANNGVVQSGNSLSAIPPGRYIMMAEITQTSSALNWPTITATGASALNLFATTAATGIASASFVAGPPQGATTTAGIAMWAFDASTTWSWTAGAWASGTISTFDIYLVPIGTGLLMSDSRKAVDWDPISILSRRLADMELQIAAVRDVDDEKYIDSEVSTPMHVEPELTRSTQDLASSLLSRLQIGNAVTRKGHFPPAA